MNKIYLDKEKLLTQSLFITREFCRLTGKFGLGFVILDKQFYEFNHHD
jgi:hypothetical protein